MKKFKKLIYTLLVLLICSIVSIYYCNQQIVAISNGKLYNSTVDIPYKKTGLLLGTGKFLKNGNINPYYQYRINACVDLLKAKKIKYLVISGDNGNANYDEPTMMRNDLILEGIDSTIIYLDYAGFRTFDSMVRLKEIFGQTDVTIVSQQFHNERAIFIAEKEGINSIGFNAQDVPINVDFKVKTREKLARVKVFVDYLLHTKPKFLGKKITIPA
jgi:SanA protein